MVHKQSTIFAFCVVVLSIHTIAAWNVQTYDASNFFDGFNFFTSDDPTHGYVNYVSRDVAHNKGLINTNNNKVYIGADHTNKASGRGRDAVRIVSNKNFNKGIFVFDLDHMPQGCGTWPAYWLVGPNWPNSGEIDIIEGVNKQLQDKTTLHTSNGCTQGDVSTSSFSGRWDKNLQGQPATNCYISAPNQVANFGCGIIANQGNYGAGLNGLGGGVYAVVWNETRIIAYFFTHSQTPADIKNNNPNPNTWGKPYANFVLGNQCPANKFRDMQVVINLTFCGDWAGAVFGQDCPGLGSCNSYVQDNPSKFTDAYWSINHLKVFT